MNHRRTWCGIAVAVDRFEYRYGVENMQDFLWFGCVRRCQTASQVHFNKNTKSKFKSPI